MMACVISGIKRWSWKSATLLLSTSPFCPHLGSRSVGLPQLCLCDLCFLCFFFFLSSLSEEWSRRLLFDLHSLLLLLSLSESFLSLFFFFFSFFS